MSHMASHRPEVDPPEVNPSDQPDSPPSDPPSQTERKHSDPPEREEPDSKVGQGDIGGEREIEDFVKEFDGPVVEVFGRVGGGGGGGGSSADDDLPKKEN